MSTRNTKGDDNLMMYMVIAIGIMVTLLLFGEPTSKWDQPNHIGLDIETGYYLIKLDSIQTYYHTYSIDVTNLYVEVDSNLLFFDSFNELNLWIGARMREDKEAVDNLIQMMTNYCEYETSFHK